MIYLTGGFSLENLPALNLLGASWKVEIEAISRSDILDALEAAPDFQDLSTPAIRSELGVRGAHFNGLRPCFTLRKGDICYVVHVSPFVSCWKVEIKG